MNVICNHCDATMDEGDRLHYEERDVNWKGWKCPYCRTTDDFSYVDWQFAVDELNGMIDEWLPRGSPRLKRLIAIKDLIEGEIE